MRKILPFIYSVLYAFTAALLIEGSLCIASAIMSPFYNNYRVFLILIGIVILSILAIIALAIANIRSLLSYKRLKFVIRTEAISFAVLLFPFWKMWEIVFEYTLFAI